MDSFIIVNELYSHKWNISIDARIVVSSDTEEKKVGRCIFMESEGIHQDFKCICKFCFKI